MSEIALARDLVTDDFCVVDADASNLETHLKAAKNLFTILTNEEGMPVALYSRTRPLVDNVPVIVVDVETSLRQIILQTAETLFNFDILGLIVQDESVILGVLPTEILVEHVEEPEMYSPLPGKSLSRAKWFRCTVEGCKYRRLVIRYDPDNPPACPNHYIDLELVE